MRLKKVELARASKSTEQAFTRRHATFTVIHRKKKALGLLTSEESVMQCQVCALRAVGVVPGWMGRRPIDQLPAAAFVLVLVLLSCPRRPENPPPPIHEQHANHNAKVDLARLLAQCEISQEQLPLCRPGQRRPAGGGHLTVRPCRLSPSG